MSFIYAKEGKIFGCSMYKSEYHESIVTRINYNDITLCP